MNALINHGFKKIIAGTFLAFLMSFLFGCQRSLPAEYVEWNEEGEGLSFTREYKYIIDKPINAFPLTVETTIKIAPDIDKRAGVIFSSYDDRVDVTYCFEIHDQGHPRLYLVGSHENDTDIVFDKVKVNTGEKLHLALVHLPNKNQLRCYINGELKQTASASFERVFPKGQMMIGGDERNDNLQYFKGRLYNLCLYNNSRNEKELTRDIVEINKNDRHLLAAFDMSNVKEERPVDDYSNKYTISIDNLWIKDVKKPKNYDYSIAVVGDTQTLMDRWPNEFHKIYDYIIDHKDSDKIKYCLGLGDIVERDTEEEWLLARTQIDRLNNVVPYSVLRGNHDSHMGINRFFSEENEYYLSTIDGFFEEGKVENTFRVIKIGEIKYLIMTLDYGPSNEALKWANDVINVHSDHHIIIATHAYITKNGLFLNKNGPWPPSKTGGGENNGDDIWEKLIRKNNIDFVFCGHDASDSIVIRKDYCNKGNCVYEILVNPQDVDKYEPTGMVAMFYFNTKEKKIDIRYYSTVKKMWLKRSNQMSIELQ